MTRDTDHASQIDVNAREDAFYVGYLPLPRAHRRFLQVVVPLTIFAMLVSAFALASQQPAWGQGVWELAEAKTFTGVIHASPYPMLVLDPDSDIASDEIPAFLLVLPGKIGAQAEANSFDRQRVELLGYELHRDGRRVIELDISIEAPITPKPGLAAPPIRPRETAGTASVLEGEILDSKCFIGAMKPGYGRGHKACATNCISGGIPPMIVTADQMGEPVYTLLVDTDGKGLTDEKLGPLLPLIAEPVRIEGRFGTAHGWRTLSIDPASAITLR